jgi:hypothetical protein
MYNPDHIIKNITADDIEYYTCTVVSENLDGIPIIAAGESVNLATYNNMPRIFSCAELKTHILAGSIIFVHESVELSAAESLEYYMTMGFSKRL